MSNTQHITMDELKEKLPTLSENELVLDVRTAEEFEEVRIKGTKNIPHDEIWQHIDELKKYEKIYIHCRSGGRAGKAVEVLEQAGLKNLVCIGTTGMLHWIDAGHPVEEN
jgi:rhodanese-related sulfurtransferase